MSVPSTIQSLQTKMRQLTRLKKKLLDFCLIDKQRREQMFHTVHCAGSYQCLNSECTVHSCCTIIYHHKMCTHCSADI